jgi:alcohol dehydrogenase class IV
MSEEAAAAAAADVVADLIQRIGMPRRLRDLDIPKADIPKLAEATLGDGGCAYNAVPVTSAEQVIALLEKVW